MVVYRLKTPPAHLPILLRPFDFLLIGYGDFHFAEDSICSDHTFLNLAIKPVLLAQEVFFRMFFTWNFTVLSAM